MSGRNGGAKLQVSACHDNTNCTETDLVLGKGSEVPHPSHVQIVLPRHFIIMLHEVKYNIMRRTTKISEVPSNENFTMI